MSNALPHDVLRDKPAPLPVRRPSTALACVAPNPLTALAMNETSLWKRLECVHMSDAERRAAVDALLLGRDIGRALQHLERIVRRWLGKQVGARHGRHASLRQLMKTRRARLYRGATTPRVPASRSK